jgi:hypothetical protein
MPYRLLVLFAVAMLAACGSNSAKSTQGESCRTGADCAKGLACIFEVCVVDEVPIAIEATQCVVIECEAPGDCDPYPPGYHNACTLWQSNCAADPETNVIDCNNYAALCELAIGCTDYQCTYTCASDVNCGGGRTCSDGRCVECTSNADCDDDEYCSDYGDCNDRCDTDGDCALAGDSIYSCNFDSGRCEFSPCTLDRECAALLEDPRAICLEDGTCAIECQSDRECNWGSFDAEFYVCDSGVCTYVGCESDLECRVVLDPYLGSGDRAACIPLEL